MTHTRYYPYGRVRSQAGAPPTDKLFTGQQRETAGGIYHYNARMYSADIGRFPQADTVVPDTTDPQALNRYSYVRNSPVMYNDPTGNFSDVGPWLLPPIPESLHGVPFTFDIGPGLSWIRFRLLSVWEQLGGTVTVECSNTPEPGACGAVRDGAFWTRLEINWYWYWGTLNVFNFSVFIDGVSSLGPINYSGVAIVEWAGGGRSETLLEPSYAACDLSVYTCPFSPLGKTLVDRSGRTPERFRVTTVRNGLTGGVLGPFGRNGLGIDLTKGGDTYVTCFGRPPFFGGQYGSRCLIQ
jgi:RHS repeat-associated protein